MDDLRSNPHKGIDGDDRDEISAMEALKYYVWKHPHGELLETLRKEFFEKDVNTLLRLGYIKSNLGVHYNITEKGKRMFDLMFKPCTWTGRLTAMKNTFAGQTSSFISKHTKSDSMTIFFNNKSKDDSPKPYDILKEFQEEMHKIADDFAEKFPAGTFVKEWYGNDNWNPTFCYISSKPHVDLDETPLTNYNIEQYKKCKGNKDESCISVHYVPINIYNLDNTCSLWWSNSFSLCENRHFEKSSFDEYREYMLNKFKDNVEHFKEQLKRDRELIRDNKRRINRIDKDMGKAIEILNKNYEIAIKKLNK